jgi:hypothetical protein
MDDFPPAAPAAAEAPRVPEAGSTPHQTGDVAQAAPVSSELVAIATSPGSASERVYGGQTVVTVAVTELVTTVDGRRAFHKTPRAYEDPEDTRFLMDGEELVPLVAWAVRAPVAPAYRDAPDSVWVEHIGGTPEGADRLRDSPEAIRIALLDAMVGNHGRAGNLLVVDGRLVGVNHGGAWLPVEIGELDPYLREPDAPMRHFVDGERGTWRDDPPITAAEAAEIRPRTEALRPAFERAGRTAWLDYSLGVLDQIAQRATNEPYAPLTPHQAQAAVPLRWHYEDRAIEPGHPHLADPEAVTAAVTDYVWDKPTNPRYGIEYDQSRMCEPWVNRALRNPDEMTPERAETITRIDEALDASRIGRPITVYRGYSNGTAVMPDDWQDRDLTGLQWTDPAYTSTSSDFEAGETYAGFPEDRGFALRIALPEGTPAIAIRDDPGGLDDEGEIVLQRGLTFRITHDRGQGAYGIRWLDAEVTPPPARSAVRTETAALQRAQGAAEDAELTIHDVIEADADMAEQIAAGMDQARNTADGCDRLYARLEALRAHVVELRVPGALEGMVLGLMDQTASVRSGAETIAERLPTAAEAIATAGSTAEARHRPLADAVRDAGHTRPAERDYHNE